MRITRIIYMFMSSWGNSRRYIARWLLIALVSGITCYAASAAPKYRVVAWGDINYDLVVDSGRQGRGSPVVQIAAGSFHSMLLEGDGLVRAWGENDFGQVDIPPVLPHRPVAQIAAGNIMRTLIMGFLWFFGMYFYGMGATQLGPLGTSLGWPLFMTTMVLVANFWGVLTGEWKNAGPKARGYLTAANAVMIAALIVISLGTRG